MEVLTRKIAQEYRLMAERLPPNGMQDIGERRKLRMELQSRCALSEVEAVNVINGYHVDLYILASERRIREKEEENED